MELNKLFKLMSDKGASDLFFSAGAPAQIKIEGEIVPVNSQVLDAEVVKRIAYALMSEEQANTFEATLEMNFGLSVADIGRFRVNVFRQRGSVAMVIRFITDRIPSMADLGLPNALKQLSMEKRGLVLIVGATGSGKSTTLASMIDYRNTHRNGHILTIEDPIEFIHRHKKSIVNQREIGIDTASYGNALVNALREAPDVLLIGEIRDIDTMRQALIYTQTGHLCLATLHANNAYHAMNRVISFFPPEAQESLLMELALSLKGVVSQRLLKGVNGKRVAAVEVLLNTLHIAELIQRREIDRIREAMEQSMVEGSQTFEHALLGLYESGKVTLEEAKQYADSRSNLEWMVANSSKYKEKLAGMRQSSIHINHAVEKPEADGVSLDELTISPDMLSLINGETGKR